MLLGRARWLPLPALRGRRPPTGLRAHPGPILNPNPNSNPNPNQVEDAIVRPRLWLCGHIHEGRGHLSDAFGGFKRVPQPGECFGALAPDGDALELDAGPGSEAHGTLVVNCANANSGRAAWLEHGAAVIHYNPNAPAAATVAATTVAAAAAAAAASVAAAPAGSASALPATASSTAAVAATATSTSGATAVEPSPAAAVAAAAAAASGAVAPSDAAPREQILLAIDLGLKSGAALYDGRGALLRYASFQLLNPNPNPNPNRNPHPHQVRFLPTAERRGAARRGHGDAKGQ